MTTIDALISRIDRLKHHGLNSLDVEIEIALFQPNEVWTAIRPNSAGTKVIFTTPDGLEVTAWAWDWTLEENRAATIERLRAHKDGDRD